MLSGSAEVRRRICKRSSRFQGCVGLRVNLGPRSRVASSKACAAASPVTCQEDDGRKRQAELALDEMAALHPKPLNPEPETRSSRSPESRSIP